PANLARPAPGTPGIPDRGHDGDMQGRIARMTHLRGPRDRLRSRARSRLRSKADTRRPAHRARGGGGGDGGGTPRPRPAQGDRSKTWIDSTMRRANSSGEASPAVSALNDRKGPDASA